MPSRPIARAEVTETTSRVVVDLVMTRGRCSAQSIVLDDNQALRGTLPGSRNILHAEYDRGGFDNYNGGPLVKLEVGQAWKRRGELLINGEDCTLLFSCALSSELAKPSYTSIVMQGTLCSKAVADPAYCYLSSCHGWLVENSHYWIQPCQYIQKEACDAKSIRAS
jgi:hypothetical protein